ncbi:MAG: hypothetical protein ACRED5_07130 [Propylenella sp.]
MPLLAWLKGLSRDTQSKAEKRVRIRKREEQPLSNGGDMRGSYGFGRRAHRPDPGAQYGFENDANYWAHHSRG